MHVVHSYEDLLSTVYGKGRESIHGTHTLTNVVYESTWSMEEFPINTLRKSYWKKAIREIRCYVNGVSNLEGFHKENVDTWDSNANNDKWLNSKYCNGVGDLGRIYGVQLRSWVNKDGELFDQFNRIVNELDKGMDNRGNIMTMWNPGELHMGCLRPCMYGYHFYIDEFGKLSLKVDSRSMDVPLGGNFNIVQAWWMLGYMAARTKHTPGTYSIHVTNAHIYPNQMETVKEELQRPIEVKPQLRLIPDKLGINYADTFFYLDEYFELVNYKHGEAIRHAFTTTDGVDKL